METGAAIREFVKTRPIYCKVGKVVKVEPTTCDVALVEDENVKFEKVRLKAHLQGDKSIIIKPTVNSFVLLGLLSSTDAFIAQYDEVDSVSMKMFDHEVLFDTNGLLVNLSNGKLELKNNSISLVKLFESIAEIVSKLKVPTPSGLSDTPFPDTILAVEKFKQDLKTLLK